MCVWGTSTQKASGETLSSRPYLGSLQSVLGLGSSPVRPSTCAPTPSPNNKSAGPDGQSVELPDSQLSALPPPPPSVVTGGSGGPGGGGAGAGAPEGGRRVFVYRESVALLPFSPTPRPLILKDASVGVGDTLSQTWRDTGLRACGAAGGAGEPGGRRRLGKVGRVRVRASLELPGSHYGSPRTPPPENFPGRRAPASGRG